MLSLSYRIDEPVYCQRFCGRNVARKDGHDVTSSARVLLSAQNVAAQLTGTQATGVTLTPDRIALAKADVARVSRVASRDVLQRERQAFEADFHTSAVRRRALSMAASQ
jgi:hypothetical protein